ncbi:hypothetical protein AAZX31_11G120400 [Glycine max]|uniref:Uncharacterized protein n=2 Tax=Glycine subgen. Soja TaxID=1462606 RepID=K7LPC1_SOYBN|nr:hypothetical protein JHK87_030690 [Glycine soja]KAG4988445.1 hypothetical protein JHK85_031428 [Glycine max]KAG4994052.1 hypothetical protein JHK86_030879 [Glycine max]KAG5124048.1 hypothetical protein JHK82_030785 [Glycine max]KAG5145465.1 hypothetical protein JHK84_031008 [Glycine max]
MFCSFFTCFLALDPEISPCYTPSISSPHILVLGFRIWSSMPENSSATASMSENDGSVVEDSGRESTERKKGRQRLDEEWCTIKFCT